MDKTKAVTTVTMPAMALRGITMFPDMTLHFEVEREVSLRALEQAMEKEKRIFLVTQRDISQLQVDQDDLYEIGCVSTVKQVLRLPGDNARVMAEGVYRGRLRRLSQRKPYLAAEVEIISEEELPEKENVRAEVLLRTAYELFQEYAELSGKLTGDVVLSVLASRNPGHLADFITQSIPMRYEDKQTVLEQLDPCRRLSQVNQLLRRELQIMRLDQELHAEVRERVNESQKEYYLREQLKLIQEELGETDSGDDEIRAYTTRIEKAKLPEAVAEKLKKELGRMAKQPYGSAEAAVLRNYLDVCLELPWSTKTRERINLAQARKILDADHYGMEKVKTRILEFLAVKKMAPDLKGQIICLVGPPGVGKTSIAASVAKALNRKMARVSLGGVRDEAEIRGHRKTYIGAMPGRIINAINTAGSSNPLILLDEVDKLGSDYRGDPSSALLEVLDSEQNSTFRDHFIELPFDLSDVLFITTCNTLDTVPRPLLDRMEVIEVSSYTDEEKLQIARRHLLPREMKRHGLTGAQLRVTDGALRSLIVGYTKESGVRQLERELAALCRKAAMALTEGESKRVNVTEDNLERFLGVAKYRPERLDREPQVGLVNGLAWTSVGGELLEVEVSVMPGTGKLMPTGNLGDVMKESCQAAISFIRSNAKALGVDPDFYQNKDIHIHFPEGAVPKDGPSAGVAITTAIVSALTNTPVRRDVAMTGEVTIRGRVLPIGGLREKTMAAFRNGIRTVIIPEDNRKDLEEIDQTVRQGLHFVTATQAQEVLNVALLHNQEVTARPLVSAHADPGEDTQSVELHTPVAPQESAKRPHIAL
jgi:ATP-dependent Lon protease